MTFLQTAPFRRSLMAGGIALLAAGAPLLAEEAAGSDPEPFVQLTVPDVATTQERYAASPYAKLAETQWAQFGTTMAETQAAQTQPEALTIIKSLTSVTLAVDVAAMAEPSIGAWIRSSDIQALVAMITAEGDFTPVEGEEGSWSNLEGAKLTAGEDVLTVAQGTQSLNEPDLSGADGDLNLRLHYGALTEMMAGMAGAGMDGPDQATLDMVKNMVVDIEYSIDPIGIREKMITSGVDVAMMGDWSKIEAKRELLESLPADTLWAATSSADREIIQTWLASPQAQEMLANPGIAQMDMMLAGWGLPDYVTLVGAIGGDHMIYARTSAPFPALTMQIGIEEEVGKQVLTAIANQAGWMDAGDGTYQGLAGMSPIFGAYAEGHLILTTHPGGIAAHTGREPGFFTNEQVQAALGELPEGKTLQVIGLSRSGDWWGSLADIGAPFAAQSGVPGIALLGQDLRGALSYGFLWSSMDAEGNTEIQSGGPLGGAMTAGVLMAGGAGAWAFWQQQQMMMMQGGAGGGNFDDAQ